MNYVFIIFYIVYGHINNTMYIHSLKTHKSRVDIYQRRKCCYFDEAPDSRIDGHLGMIHPV